MSDPVTDPMPAGAADGLDTLCINTLRTLAMDAVQKADSGHPGTPMALAPVIYTLWRRFLRFDPQDPQWPNRDRFVLSNGHASMLLYGMLHLAGVREAHGDAAVRRDAVTLDDIKAFRELGSRCPGHPEFGVTSGVEATTGPLGQGLGMSVGMAMAGVWQAARFNRPDHTIFDYDVYALCGDGDMMEGVASEAASLAGQLMLGKLCWIYDSNKITIEGHTDLAFSENVAARFLAYGWNVEHVGDANDTARLAEAFQRFQGQSRAPTLIIVESHIGYGAPHKQDTSAAHGEPLGEEEIRLAKRSYGWPEDAAFLVPPGVCDHVRDAIAARLTPLKAAWSDGQDAYGRAHPDLALQMTRIQAGDAPDGWDADLPTFAADAKGLATRESSGKVLNAIARRHDWLIGGAADLAPSTKTRLTFEGAGDLEAEAPGGRNIHFGIREHAMGAVVNGLTLSGLKAFGSTFLIFSDYMKAAIRLSALMEQPAVFIFTHDSIGLGQDGPTHQPVEQLLGLRAIPNLLTLRPADANEVVEAWRVVMGLKTQPACLVLTRQAVPTLDRRLFNSAAGVARGGYVLADATPGAPSVILMGTGSELGLCVEAYEVLKSEGVAVRLVSLPSWELFEAQDPAYRASVLPPDVTARVSVEAASVLGWDRYVGASGARIGMTTFGASAPISDLEARFGFTTEAVLAAARAQLAKLGKPPE
jgi:transketolase